MQSFPLPKTSSTTLPAHSLCELRKGDQAQILEIRSQELEVALLKLGVSKGDQLVLSNVAPFGGPMAICINGTKISLRKQDASHIWITRS